MDAAGWRLVLGAPGCRDEDVRFADEREEAALVAAGATRTPLVSHGVVRVHGDDAAAFLHAQLTAACRDLDPGTGLDTAWCSPKGRVLFLPTVLRLAETEFLLLLPRDQTQAFRQRLALFVLRAAVTIEDLDTTHGALVWRTTDGDRSPPPPGAIIESAAPGMTTRCWQVGTAETLARAWCAWSAPPVGLRALALADLRAGRPRLDKTLADRFLPQELDLDALGGVSFEKGCYPGQEVIARVRFRGSVKRRPRRIKLTLPEPPPPGARLLDAGDRRPRGTVLYGAPDASGGCECLCVTEVEAQRLMLEGDEAAAATLTGPPPASVR